MHRHTHADYDPLFSRGGTDAPLDGTAEPHVAADAPEASPLRHHEQRTAPQVGASYPTAHAKQNQFVATEACRASARSQMEWLLPAILDNGCAGNEWALNRYAQLDAMAYPRDADGIAVLDNHALDALLAEMGTLGRFLAMAPTGAADAETIAWARRRHDQVDALFTACRRLSPPPKRPGVLDVVSGYVHDNPAKVGALLGIVLGGALFNSLHWYWCACRWRA
ncbi:hypothetical protein pneo_cds_591 [Pandoravirus neocaledonia]|uniref:Uncharacterized protein n=1 Tax=Pandoravirus neocaledonia TaxID=2107708 RepID=A0A2U7UCK4_9VIRU|nr:hypothetical protein pneo_cds_591 [Pandoravirus neocaledonia]AVK76198.1 hypothetical protein pneo_cds_591 [Pandoravirus neocaledonia]